MEYIQSEENLMEFLNSESKKIQQLKDNLIQQKLFFTRIKEQIYNYNENYTEFLKVKKVLKFQIKNQKKIAFKTFIKSGTIVDKKQNLSSSDEFDFNLQIRTILQDLINLQIQEIDEKNQERRNFNELYQKFQMNKQKIQNLEAQSFFNNQEKILNQYMKNFKFLSNYYQIWNQEQIDIENKIKKQQQPQKTQLFGIEKCVKYFKNFNLYQINQSYEEKIYSLYKINKMYQEILDHDVENTLNKYNQTNMEQIFIYTTIKSIFNQNNSIKQSIQRYQNNFNKHLNLRQEAKDERFQKILKNPYYVQQKIQKRQQSQPILNTESQIQDKKKNLIAQKKDLADLCTIQLTNIDDKVYSQNMQLNIANLSNPDTEILRNKSNSQKNLGKYFPITSKIKTSISMIPNVAETPKMITQNTGRIVTRIGQQKLKIEYYRQINKKFIDNYYQRINEQLFSSPFFSIIEKNQKISLPKSDKEQNNSQYKLNKETKVILQRMQKKQLKYLENLQQF